MKVFDFLRNTGGMSAAGRNPESRPSLAMDVVIKERVSPNEAIVEIEGKKVKAVFENGVPAQSRASVQVTSAREGVIQVRVAQQTGTGTDSSGKTGENAERTLRDAGIKATPEMREAARILFEGKQPVTKETMKNVEQILQKGEGTVRQKLDTLQILVKKNIHVTAKSFEAVFRTLHGPTLDQLVERMADELPELAGKPTGSEESAARTARQVARTEMLEKNAQPEKPESRLTRQLATLRDAIVQAEKQKGTIDKEQLQKLIREMESTLKTVKEDGVISRETAQKVELLTKQMQTITQSALGQTKVTTEQLTRVADRNELNKLIKTIATEGKARERIEAPASLSNSRAEGSHALARQLETLVKAISARQPVNKEALQQLVQQVKSHPELVRVNPDVREQIQKAVQQLEQAVREVPREEKTVQPERLKRLDSSALNDAVKQVVRELEARKTGQVSNAEQVSRRTTPAESLPHRLETLAKVVAAGQPVNKEALRQIVELVKRDPALVQLSKAVREQIQKVVGQMEQAMRETPQAEKTVSADRLGRLVDRVNLEQATKSAVREVSSALVIAAPKSERGEKAAHIEDANGNNVHRLSQKIEVLAKAVSSGQSINKEALRQLVEQIKQSPELARLSAPTREQIQKAVKQIEQTVHVMRPNEQEVPAERTARFVDRIALIQTVKQATYELNYKAEELQGDAPEAQMPRNLQTSSTGEANAITRKTSHSNTSEQLLSRLETLAKAVDSKVEIDKEVMRRLAAQMEESTAALKTSPAAQRYVQSVAASLERAVQQTPLTQSMVPTEILTKQIDRVALEQAIKNMSVQHDDISVQPEEQPSPDAKSQVAAVEKETMPQESISLKAQREVAERVLAMRTEGRVTRQQIEGLQQAVQNLIREAGGSAALQQDTRRFMEQVSKELRMSMSYEAVGRSAEGKMIVQRAADQLIQAFKLPVAEAAKGEAVQRQADAQKPSSPAVLETMAQTYDRLSGIVAAAHAEMQSSSGVTASALLQGKETLGSSLNIEAARMPQQILQDIHWLLEAAIETEGLPEEMVQKLDPLLSTLEEAAVSQTSFAVGEMDALEQDATLRMQVDADAALTQIQDLFEEEVGRLAAYANVQAANFERVSHYIPENLRQVAEEFTQTKKEILNNIERMSQFLRQEIPQAASYIKQVIEPTIEMVNRLVSKGEFALFADMEFEHSVLKISGQLQDIKSMLDKGQTEQALRSFQTIRSEMEKLNWQPSYMKVERFFSKKAGEGKLQNPFELYSQEWKSNELTGRGVQEWMRGMGLGYEREAIEWMGRRTIENREMGGGVWNGSSIHSGQSSALPSGMSSGHKSDAFPSFSQSGQQSFQSQDERPQNMKSMIMDQLENGNLSPRVREVLEQTLSNVTGQQLLSKHEPGAPVQTMYFQMPLPWEEGVQNVQMQIHSRNNREQMDWENCSLFFFLSTPKFGDTGIGVTVVERDMTLRIQNNHPQVEKSFEPYIPQLMDQLQGLGYRVQGISFGKMNEPIQEKQSPSLPLVDVKKARTQAASFTVREGVDFSI